MIVRYSIYDLAGWDLGKLYLGMYVDGAWQPIDDAVFDPIYQTSTWVTSCIPEGAVFALIYAEEAGVVVLDPLPETVREPELTVSGTAEKGSTVEILSGGETRASCTADSSGRFTAGIVLNEGENRLTARAVDNAGEPSAEAVVFSKPYETVISLTLGGMEARADGGREPLDAAPFMCGGVVIVPFRFVGEALGASVDWLSFIEGAIAEYLDISARIIPQRGTVFINDNPIGLTPRPEMVSGRLFVPVNFFREHFGCSVVVEGDSIIISK